MRQVFRERSFVRFFECSPAWKGKRHGKHKYRHSWNPVLQASSWGWNNNHSSTEQTTIRAICKYAMSGIAWFSLSWRPITYQQLSKTEDTSTMKATTMRSSWNQRMNQGRPRIARPLYFETCSRDEIPPRSRIHANRLKNVMTITEYLKAAYGAAYPSAILLPTSV